MPRNQKDEHHGLVTVEFSTGKLGLELISRRKKYGAEILNLTRDSITGHLLPAELSNLLEVGMVLVRIGEVVVVDAYFNAVLERIRTSARPVSFTFAYVHSKALSKAGQLNSHNHQTGTVSNE